MQGLKIPAGAGEMGSKEGEITLEYFSWFIWICWDMDKPCAEQQIWGKCLFEDGRKAVSLHWGGFRATVICWAVGALAVYKLPSGLFPGGAYG